MKLEMLFSSGRIFIPALRLLKPGGKERQKGDTEEQQTVSFTVRFCKKLSELSAADYRIVFRGKTYNILQVDFADYDGKTVKIKAESEENYGSISTGNDE